MFGPAYEAVPLDEAEQRAATQTNNNFQRRVLVVLLASLCFGLVCGLYAAPPPSNPSPDSTTLDIDDMFTKLRSSLAAAEIARSIPSPSPSPPSVPRTPQPPPPQQRQPQQRQPPSSRRASPTPQSRSHTKSVTASKSIMSPTPTFTPEDHTKEPDRKFQIIPVEPFWDGRMDTWPEPLPKGFGGAPLPEAVGKFAYVTMFDLASSDDRYKCMTLALVSSIRASGISSAIDLVVAVIHRPNRPIKERDLPIALGEMYYNAFVKAGVTFIIWQPFPLTPYHRGNFLRMAYAKFRVWTLVQYEKVLFLDSDTLVLHNLDHLFENGEFTAAAVWMGTNSASPKTPSGGFFIAEPRMDTYHVIERYMEGRDPCGYMWDNADMTMIKVLFMDLASYADRQNSGGAVFDKERWPRYDGDIDMFKLHELGIKGRCFQRNAWPDREDAVWPIPPTFPNGTKRKKFLSAKNRWNMLNESYDMLVIPCSSNNLRARYNKFPDAPTMWERAGAFSLHISPGNKPKCSADKEDQLAPCVREVFVEWRKFLNMFLDT